MTSNVEQFSRRAFLGATGATVAVAGFGGLVIGGQNAQADQDQKPRTRSLRLGHLTDVHVQPERSAAAGLMKALHHAQSQTDPPQLLLAGGDSIMDSLAASLGRTKQQWQLWKQVLQDECSLPVEPCIGNHDVWGWNREGSRTTGDEAGWGKQRALDEFQIAERYRSFDRAGWHFVVLDSIFPDEETVYQGRLDEEQFDWLAADLQATDAQTPVLVLSHMPILTVASVEFEPQLVENPARRRMTSHQDAQRIVHLFKQHANVKLCLSGHLHLTERLQYAGVTYVCSGAVSGNWWKGDHHGTEEGYSIVDLYDDGTFDWQYNDYGWTVPA
jgi:3',5'-cyclic AMP phosphodiesterase CpdA